MNATGYSQTRLLALLVALGTLWGSSFMIVKLLVDEISPAEIVAGRLALGAAVLIVFLAARRALVIPGSGLLLHIALLGAIDTVAPWTLVAWSQTRIDSGIASVLVSTMPLFTTIFAVTAFPDERITPARALGVCTAFAGVVVVTDGRIFSATGGDALGLLSVVAAGALYGLGAVYARFLLRRMDPVRLTSVKLTTSALIAAPLAVAWSSNGSFSSLELSDWALLAVLGVVATGFAWTAYFWIVSKAGSVRASLVTYIVPISGIALGGLVMGERIGPEMLAGGLLMAAGIAAVMYAPALKVPRFLFASARHGSVEATETA
jgi:drug/metabolite transporter (DMT)-like permease